MKLRRLSTRRPGLRRASSRRSRATTPRRTRRCRRRCARSSPTCASAATPRCAPTRRNSTGSLPRRIRRLDRQAPRRDSRRAGARRCARRTTRIRAFHERQLQKSWEFTDADGTRLGQQVSPLERVGLYVPGGKAAYPSSVLMNAVPAKVAGVRELVMASPNPNPLVLAAAALAGVDRVLGIGGAQAIAALAYGTKSIAARRQDRRPGQRLRRRGEAPGVRRGRHRHDRRPLRDPGDRRRQRARRLGGDGPVLAGRARRVGAGDPAFSERGVSGRGGRFDSASCSPKCRGGKSLPRR